MARGAGGAGGASQKNKKPRQTAPKRAIYHKIATSPVIQATPAVPAGPPQPSPDRRAGKIHPQIRGPRQFGVLRNLRHWLIESRGPRGAGTLRKTRKRSISFQTLQAGDSRPHCEAQEERKTRKLFSSVHDWATTVQSSAASWANRHAPRLLPPAILDKIALREKATLPNRLSDVDRSCHNGRGAAGKPVTCFTAVNFRDFRFRAFREVPPGRPPRNRRAKSR
jgi:hypothetical protein